MKRIHHALICNLLILSGFLANAQVKFGNNPTVINANSLIELESTNKGFLFPRVALTQTSLPAPLAAHVQGMTIFNTATVNDVNPGLYYNDGTKWVNVSMSSQYWNLAGNAGTNAATNFIGTTDNVDLVFKINNKVSGWLNSSLSNTSFGLSSLPIATTGAQNTAIGTTALQNNNTGYLNTAVGSMAMQYNIFGGLNTSIGTQSIQQNFAGNNNTAVGYISLTANANGNGNTAIGTGALSTNVNANNNTAIGFNAGSNFNSGDNNIVIGYNAQPSSAAVSNEVTIGNPSNSTYRVYNNWVVLSDKTAKHDIKDIPVGLDFIMGLTPVEFVYNSANNGAKSLGFLAQDVQSDMQQSNLDKSYDLVSKMDEKYLGLNTTEIVPILTKAIQEQQKIIEAQNKRIEKLEKLLLAK